MVSVTLTRWRITTPEWLRSTWSVWPGGGTPLQTGWDWEARGQCDTNQVVDNYSRMVKEHVVSLTRLRKTIPEWWRSAWSVWPGGAKPLQKHVVSVTRWRETITEWLGEARGQCEQVELNHSRMVGGKHVVSVTRWSETILEWWAAPATRSD